MDARALVTVPSHSQRPTRPTDAHQEEQTTKVNNTQGWRCDWSGGETNISVYAAAAEICGTSKCTKSTWGWQQYIKVQTNFSLTLYRLAFKTSCFEAVSTSMARAVVKGFKGLSGVSCNVSLYICRVYRTSSFILPYRRRGGTKKLAEDILVSGAVCCGGHPIASAPSTHCSTR